MGPAHSGKSLFRSIAWVSAWLETWGCDPRVTLIDLGGKANALDYVYTFRHRLKKVIPVRSMLVAGFGFAGFQPPRAEYNDFRSFIELCGDLPSFGSALATESWNQFVATDFFSTGTSPSALTTLATLNNWSLKLIKQELAFRINAATFDGYLVQLGDSTREKYFSRREKLGRKGCVERITITEPSIFFDQLDKFHSQRWGRNCYSPLSRRFMTNFIDRLPEEGGVAQLEFLLVDGEIVSALFDILWNGVRYNLQSGFLERKYSQISLGSIHFGFAIEESIKKGLTYDLLAGSGKNASYKEKIATHVDSMDTYILARGLLKHLYSMYGK